MKRGFIPLFLSLNYIHLSVHYRYISLLETIRAAMREAKTIYLSKERGMNNIGFGFGEPGVAKELGDAEVDRDALYELAKSASEQFGDDFTIAYKANGESTFFRGRKVLTAKGVMYVLREIFKGVPSLKEGVLNLPNYFKEVVSHEFLLGGGLFLVCGSTGNGKSTTMTAALVERLKTYGGLGITIEDPPEYQMTGPIGKGYCYQLPVCHENGGSFAGAIKAALRCYPSKQRSTIMMIGEVRDSETAAQVLRDSLNGHLVFTTIHANDIVSGLSRLLSLAAQAIGQREAQDLMSHALRVVTYQKIINNKPILKMLINDGTNTGISTRIANGEVGNLTSEIMRQNNLLKINRLPIKE